MPRHETQTATHQNEDKGTDGHDPFRNSDGSHLIALISIAFPNASVVVAGTTG
jgi:hypothetical protein